MQRIGLRKRWRIVQEDRVIQLAPESEDRPPRSWGSVGEIHRNRRPMAVLQSARPPGEGDDGRHLSDDMEPDPIKDGFVVDRPSMGGPPSE